MAQRKMSDDDRKKALEMRKNGSSLQEIADYFGVTKALISRLSCKSGLRLRSIYKSQKVVYPNIRKYLRKNLLPVSAFSDLCGVSNRTMYTCLSGEVHPSKYTIDQILRVTGMTYEEAFSECEEK